MLALFLVMFMLACRTTLAILMRHSMEACSSLARSAWISIHSIDLVSQLAIVLVASKVFCAYHDIFSEVENGPSLISAQEFWIDLSVVAALALAAAACAFSWIQLINDRRLNRVATTL